MLLMESGNWTVYLIAQKTKRTYMEYYQIRYKGQVYGDMFSLDNVQRFIDRHKAL